MLSEIARLYGPTRTTVFNISVTKFRSDTKINSAIFKRERFGTGKQISASHKGAILRILCCCCECWCCCCCCYCCLNLCESSVGLHFLKFLYSSQCSTYVCCINPLNAELNPICYLLALLGTHHFLHVSRIRVKSLILRLLMSCIYGAPILDVSRSHTTTHHSR